MAAGNAAADVADDEPAEAAETAEEAEEPVATWPLLQYCCLFSLLNPRSRPLQGFKGNSNFRKQKKTSYMDRTPVAKTNQHC